MENNQIVGITETGDPSQNLEIFDHLYNANIIITKSLNDKLIDKLIEHKNKCILHLTVTGMGGSKLEPFVPTKEVAFKYFNKLIENGFPIKQVVLRIDPIIPTKKGINTALEVIKLFKDSGITRIRYSSFDMYNHVKDRFNENKIPLPYETFHADIESRVKLDEIMKACGLIISTDIETCGEPDIQSTGCIP
jgi:DNA repair photolyase